MYGVYYWSKTLAIGLINTRRIESFGMGCYRTILKIVNWRNVENWMETIFIEYTDSDKRQVYRECD